MRRTICKETLGENKFLQFYWLNMKCLGSRRKLVSMLFFRNRWLGRLKLCNGKSWWVPSGSLWFVKCFKEKCSSAHPTVQPLCLAPPHFMATARHLLNFRIWLKISFPPKSLTVDLSSVVYVGLGPVCCCMCVQWCRTDGSRGLLLGHCSGSNSCTFPSS